METVDFGRLEIRKYIDSELEQVDEDLYAELYNLCFIVLTRWMCTLVLISGMHSIT